MSDNAVTICFITGRAEPRLDWFLESLAPQVTGELEIHILVVDSQGRSPEQLSNGADHCRALGVIPGTWDASRLRVVLPKPTIWQGPHRVTSVDFWAKSSAINTALVLCETSYVAFADDACRLGPKWLATVRQGMRARDSVLAGSYDKREGDVLTTDHRVGMMPNGQVGCPASWLFGCTWACPTAYLVGDGSINGCEEGVDGMGTEDSICGLMMAHAGRRIDFVPDMIVHQQRSDVSPQGPGGAGSIPLRRIDRGVPGLEDKSHSALKRFGTRTRTEFTPDLAALRAHMRAGGQWPAPAWPLVDAAGRPLDWFDGTPIEAL